MSSKWRYILGTATIVAIVGGTVYAIKKSKDLEKSEGEAITVAEARKIIAEKNTADFEDSLEEFEELLDETAEDITPHKIELYTPEEMDEALEDAYPEVTDNIEAPTYTVEPLIDFYYFEEGINPKEDKTLRYNPNSVEAKHQFIRMELADWEPNHDIYRIMIQLFEFPFIPTTDGDEILRTQVIDYKVQFFGFNSKWNREVSFADVIFHYARSSEFNCGETIQHWVEYFIDNTGLEWDCTSEQIDTLLLRLNSHTYFNDERQTFGLFGLTRVAMDQAIRIANRNIDRSVTYEIEFNEFLKSIV